MTVPIRVLLADDHTLLRAGIRALLQGMAGVEVIAEAGDGTEALRLIQTLRPAIVLMDIAMPGINGLEATARIAQEAPDARVIVLSMHASEEYVCKALSAGAAGYLLKDAAPLELETALRTVARGETYLAQGVSRHLIADYLRRVGGEASPAEVLTARQKEILQLVAAGKTTKEMAALLHISVKTVEKHRGLLMERLNIHDIAGLVRYAIRLGLAPSEK